MLKKNTLKSNNYHTFKYLLRYLMRNNRFKYYSLGENHIIKWVIDFIKRNTSITQFHELDA